METLLEILKYVIPSGITLATAYLLITRFLDNEARKHLVELKQNQKKELLNTRIQSYERCILYLERITPSSMIPRIYKNGMSARFFQSELIQAIRNEFEHNLTTQLYMSQGAWEMIKNAKEETVKIINICGSKLDDTATGGDLAKHIYEVSMGLDKMPSQIAIDYLKKEFSLKFE